MNTDKLTKEGRRERGEVHRSVDMPRQEAQVLRAHALTAYERSIGVENKVIRSVDEKLSRFISFYFCCDVYAGPVLRKGTGGQNSSQ